MKDNPKFRELINDVTFKEWVLGSNAESIDKWENWIEQHPEKSAKILIARQFIEMTARNEHSLGADEIDKEVSILLDRIKRKELHSKTISKAAILQNGKFFMKWAASFALLICSAFLIYHILGDSTPKMLTLTTKKGETKEIVLNDGTKVHLNADSKLVYPSKFSNDSRQVNLLGEAFFEVVKDKERPFTVMGGDLDVRVLGTVFNVSNYPDDDYIDVALLSGAVAVTLEEHPDDLISIRKSERLVFEKTSKEWNIKPIKSIDEVGWRNGILYFNEANIDLIISELERHYNFRIEVMKGLKQDVHFTGVFKNTSLDELLQGMSFTMGFKYTILIDQKTVFLVFD